VTWADDARFPFFARQKRTLRCWWRNTRHEVLACAGLATMMVPWALLYVVLVLCPEDDPSSGWIKTNRPTGM
jgi:hypothetical protein